MSGGCAVAPSVSALSTGHGYHGCSIRFKSLTPIPCCEWHVLRPGHGQTIHPTPLYSRTTERVATPSLRGNPSCHSTKSRSFLAPPWWNKSPTEMGTAKTLHFSLADWRLICSDCILAHETFNRNRHGWLHLLYFTLDKSVMFSKENHRMDLWKGSP